jgi:hypothetical protein
MKLTIDNSEHGPIIISDEGEVAKHYDSVLIQQVNEDYCIFVEKKLLPDLIEKLRAFTKEKECIKPTKPLEK